MCFGEHGNADGAVIIEKSRALYHRTDMAQEFLGCRHGH